jgi:rubrerythrin
MSFFSKNDIIEMALKMEQNGYAYYDMALQKTELPKEAVSILTRLRDEEKKHEQTFLELRTKIDDLELTDSASWADAQLYIESIIESHVFNSEEAAIKLAQNAKTREELLQHAIQFEKDTILFFFSIARHIENHKAKDALDQIINEEASHIRILRSLI